MSKKNNNISLYKKVSQELIQLNFKFRQHKAEIDKRTQYYLTHAQPARFRYEHLQLELLQLFYRLYQQKAVGLPPESQRSLKDIIRLLFDTASPELQLQAPFWGEIHQFLFNQSLEQSIQEDLEEQKHQAIDDLENYGVPYDYNAIEQAGSLLELENICIAAIEADCADVFAASAPELAHHYIPEQITQLDTIVHPYAVERLNIQRNRTIQRLYKTIELRSVVCSIIKPDFPWDIPAEELEEQAFYLEEVKRFYEALNAEELVILAYDWLEYIKDFIKILPDENLMAYIENLREFRNWVRVVTENLNEQADIDQMAQEHFTLLPDLDDLTITYRQYIEDFKEMQPLPALIDAVLQGSRQTLEHDPLTEILARVNKKLGQYLYLSEDEDEQ